VGRPSSGRSLPGTGRQSGEGYKWKSKYGGLEVTEARRLKQLEEKSPKLKQLVADLTLDKIAFKDALSKTGEARHQAPNRPTLSFVAA
jgi:hypothetical protein